MMITENLHVRVAETCVNWQKENFRVHNRIMMKSHMTKTQIQVQLTINFMKDYFKNWILQKFQNGLNILKWKIYGKNKGVLKGK